MKIAVIPFLNKFGRVSTHCLRRYSQYFTGTFKTRRTLLDTQIFIPISSQFLYEHNAFLNIFVKFLHEILLFLFFLRTTLHGFQITCLLYIKLCKLSNLFTEISVSLVKRTHGCRQLVAHVIFQDVTTCPYFHRAL